MTFSSRDLPNLSRTSAGLNPARMARQFFTVRLTESGDLKRRIELSMNTMLKGRLMDETFTSQVQFSAQFDGSQRRQTNGTLQLRLVGREPPLLESTRAIIPLRDFALNDDSLFITLLFEGVRSGIGAFAVKVISEFDGECSNPFSCDPPLFTQDSGFPYLKLCDITELYDHCHSSSFLKMRSKVALYCMPVSVGFSQIAALM